MKTIAVVGAGMSGISLAIMLKKAFKIIIFEKSSKTGGRLATKERKPFNFDHGTQYFKVNNSEFKKFLNPLLTRSIIKPWVFRYIEVGNNVIKNKNVKEYEKCFVGVPKMNSITDFLSKELDIRLNTKIVKVRKNGKKWMIYDSNNNSYGTYDWIVFTTPAVQTCEIIPNNFAFFSLINSLKMKGCYSLLLGFHKKIKLAYDAAFYHNNDISWLAKNNSKPGRQKNISLVINSSYEYAEKKKNVPKKFILNDLLKKSCKLLKQKLIPDIKILHKWNFVESEKYPSENFFLDLNQNLAVCGDWCINSRVEGAFLSAKCLSDKIRKIHERNSNTNEK